MLFHILTAKVQKKSHISKYMGDFLSNICILQSKQPFLAHYRRAKYSLSRSAWVFDTW